MPLGGTKTIDLLNVPSPASEKIGWLHLDEIFKINKK